MPELRYWAFLSYSRDDEPLARWLHRRLERFRVPRRLRENAVPSGGRAPERLRPIFRDQEELAASPDLGHQLEQAIQSSRHLVVLRTEPASRSRWVAREIDVFLSSRGPDSIIPIVPDPKCLPSSKSLHPAWATAFSESLILNDRNSIHTHVLARILGVPPQVMDGEILTQKIRKRQAVFAASILLTVSMLGLSWYADQQRRVAKHEESVAIDLRKEGEGFLQYLSSDLATALRDHGFTAASQMVQKHVADYYLRGDSPIPEFEQQTASDLVREPTR